MPGWVLAQGEQDEPIVLEVAPGVGKLTDLAVIKNGKIHVGDKNMLDALAVAHKEKPALNAEELEKLKKVCDDCVK